jgi:hypothetical protein
LIRRRILAGVLLIGLLAMNACSASQGAGAGAPPPDLFSWQGASASALQQGLGPPDETYALPSGETVMAYRWSRTQTTGGYAVSMGGYSQLGTQYVPTEVVSVNCRARFTIGPDQRVRDVDLQGNGCFAEHR